MGIKKGWFAQATAWIGTSELKNIFCSIKEHLGEITRAVGTDDDVTEQFNLLFVVNYEETKKFI